MAGPWEKYAQQSGPWTKYGAPATPAPPPEVQGPSERQGPPMPDPETSMWSPEAMGRGLRLGVQDVGRGIADLLGLPVDLATMGANALASTADTAAGWFGGEMPYRITDPIGGSAGIADASGQITDALLGEGATIPWNERTRNERIRGRAAEFGAESALGSGLVSRFRDVLPRSYTAPYEAAGSNARVLAGDLAAGVGSGGLMQTWREYAPEWMQGPVADIVTGLAGGMGGAKLLSSGEGAVNAARKVPGRYQTMPESVIPRDPQTMMPVSRGDFGRASALVQEKAFDPAKAADEISAYLAAAGEGAHPSSALITGDPGLISAERGLRVGDTAPNFIQTDQAAMGAISDKVRSTRPEGANPEAPRPVAAQSIEDQLAAARAPVTAAEGAVTAQDAAAAELAAALQQGRSLDQASRDLDRIIVEQTYLPARTQKNALYDTAAATGAEIPTTAVQQYATSMLERNLGLNPALQDQRAVALSQAFSDSLATRPLSDAVRDRQALSSTEAQARAQGNFEQADTARGLKSGIGTDVRTAAESGLPGTEALRTAETNYRENFAPLYREGYTAPDFFKAIDRDRTRGTTPPEMTAGRFLIGGPASRAAAEDVAAIIARTPDPAAATSAALDYVAADAVRSGVVRDGRISEPALARFMAQREGMFSQIPEMKARFDDLLTRVRQGNADASSLAAELDRVSKNLNLTQRQLDNGALKLIADSEPRKAVQAVFTKPDTVAAMREATRAFAGDPAAAAGWKAAVSDWLVGHVKTASKAAVDREDVTVSLQKIERVMRDNEKALAEVFSPDEMSRLKQAQARLEVLSKRGTQASSGSATAENLRGLRGVITALANPAGIVTMLTRGALMAGSVERRIKTVADQFPDADAAANKLILRAATDPRIMEHMLRFPTTDAQIYTWSAKLNELIVGGEAASGEE